MQTKITSFPTSCTLVKGIAIVSLAPNHPKKRGFPYKISASIVCVCVSTRTSSTYPSVRALAAETGLNPNTIQKAYQELESEGVIYTVGGKGCFVGGEENAAEATCRRAEAELREALRQARLAGVEKTTAEALVERCYGGNE